MGVAGGELLIPTLVLLFGCWFTSYSRDQSFAVLGRNRMFVAIMAGGSILGAFIGARLLGVIPSALILPSLAAILVFSAWKVWRNE